MAKTLFGLRGKIDRNPKKALTRKEGGNERYEENEGKE